ncbi:PEP-CTERM sorting domain-containing protein [Luteolibacter sp. LG18]|uniref:PEP-CTERM sorting domain-containing protein n=1 Tax=Luteolibacter sp. LG18 TaxID=2819286 RepID=UPI002B2F7EE9|nr:hypothetical protein llg_11690 [Luteolibacter sp. LG18]
MTFRHLLCCGLLAAATGGAHAASIQFTAINADEDGWAVVTLQDITPGTTIYFTDNEWNGSAIGSGGAFNTGESYFQWASGATAITAITAGTVIRFSAVDTTSLAATVGTLSRATVSGSTNYGISQSADTIYAYLGTAADTPTQFLAAIATTTFSAAEGVITSTGLTLGATAIQLNIGTGGDYAEYTGARTGQTTFAGYQSAVGNIANWNNPGDGNFASTEPNTTAFTVVPEPSAALIGGLGVFALIRRRR